MMKWIRRRLDANAVTKFHRKNPNWQGAETQPEISTALARHPIWQRVPADLREELSKRLVLAREHFNSFDATHSFQVFADTTFQFDLLHENFLAIVDDQAFSLPDKLSLIATTFINLGARLFQQVLQAGNTIAEDKAIRALMHSTMCFEAAICVDHYRIDAMPPMALAWVYRSQDFTKANRILEEAEKWIRLPLKQNFHSIGNFDRAVIEGTAAPMELVQAVRMDIMRLLAGRMAGSRPR